MTLSCCSEHCSGWRETGQEQNQSRPAGKLGGTHGRTPRAMSPAGQQQVPGSAQERDSGPGQLLAKLDLSELRTPIRVQVSGWGDTRSQKQREPRGHILPGDWSRAVILLFWSLRKSCSLPYSGETTLQGHFKVTRFAPLYPHPAL